MLHQQRQPTTSPLPPPVATTSAAVTRPRPRPDVPATTARTREALQATLGRPTKVRSPVA